MDHYIRSLFLKLKKLINKEFPNNKIKSGYKYYDKEKHKNVTEGEVFKDEGWFSKEKYKNLTNIFYLPIHKDFYENFFKDIFSFEEHRVLQSFINNPQFGFSIENLEDYDLSCHLEYLINRKNKEFIIENKKKYKSSDFYTILLNLTEILNLNRQGRKDYLYLAGKYIYIPSEVQYSINQLKDNYDKYIIPILIPIWITNKKLKIVIVDSTIAGTIAIEFFFEFDKPIFTVQNIFKNFQRSIKINRGIPNPGHLEPLLQYFSYMILIYLTANNIQHRLLKIKRLLEMFFNYLAWYQENQKWKNTLSELERVILIKEKIILNLLNKFSIIRDYILYAKYLYKLYNIVETNLFEIIEREDAYYKFTVYFFDYGNEDYYFDKIINTKLKTILNTEDSETVLTIINGEKILSSIFLDELEKDIAEKYLKIEGFYGFD